MKKYEVVERKDNHHVFHVEAENLIEAALLVKKHNSAMNKTPWEKVTTHVGQPEIQHIMEADSNGYS